jgi:putative transposase
LRLKDRTFLVWPIGFREFSANRASFISAGNSEEIMPRTSRAIVPNCPHHVVQRGHNRKPVFANKADYQYYLDTLIEWKKELSVKVFAYCLMTNHVHLVLDPGDDVDSIGLLMKRLAGRQTRYVNKNERRSGSLWEGRYKISAIETDAYLLQCCRYVELNPVKAWIVDRAEQYKWSSYATKIGEQLDDWLDEDPQFSSMAADLTCRRNLYRQFVEQGISEQEQNFIQQAISRSQLTGDTLFVDKIERLLGLRIEHRGRGRPKKLVKSVL